MARIATKGKCKFCEKEFSKGGMSKHLTTCPARTVTEAVKSPDKNQKNTPVKFFQLAVEGRHAPMFWMHLQMPLTATLGDLDLFLRNEWLECCGHLSAFTIGAESYVSVVDEMWGNDDKPMDNVKIGKVLSIGDQFVHEYDFGSTTELKLKVVAETKGIPVKGEPVEILAQNEPPEFKCDNCGELATQLCTECADEEGGWLCDNCAEEHECDEAMLMPVVNSPRMGVCCYGA